MTVPFFSRICRIRMQIYFRFIVKEDSVHAVIVQAVTDPGTLLRNR